MYKIEVLSNKEFDALPKSITRGSNISQSLGFADPRTGKAYVRQVAHPELQKYLINHEFKELEMAESTHEDENGIRHKSFWDIFMPWTWGGGGDAKAEATADSTLNVATPYQPIYTQPSAASPFSAFASQGAGSSQLPTAVGGSVQSTLGKGIGQGGQLPGDEELQKQKGFYSGRTTY